jgi:hypothetical protein
MCEETKFIGPISAIAAAVIIVAILVMNQVLVTKIILFI